MTLSEWIKITRSELDWFEEFWSGQSRIDAELFPPEMEPGEWDDQFISYTALRRPPEGKP